MPGQPSSLEKQVAAAELALRQIARLSSFNGQRAQRTARRALDRMTLLARESRTTSDTASASANEPT